MALIMNSCSQVDGANPSQNQAVNMVAGKKDKKPALMQNLLDNWLKTEWEPATSNSKIPTADTSVKIVENTDGSAKLVEVKSGVVLKKMTKEEVIHHKEVATKYQEEDRPFTLQEYVDKLEVYNESHISNNKDSHTAKINAMPVIGTKKR